FFAGSAPLQWRDLLLLRHKTRHWSGARPALFRGRRFLFEVVGVAQMHRRVGLPRALEVEALGNLADSREDLLAHQADAGERVLLADEAVVAPQRQDARPRLFEDALELLHHLVGRAVDDAQVLDLLFESRAAARIDGTTGGELHEGAAVGGRAVARGRAPYRMGKTGDLALHPAELLGVPTRLVLVVRDVDLDQVAAILRTADIAGLQRHLIIELPDLLGLLDRGVERDVGIALLRGPHDRLLADHARDP